MRRFRGRDAGTSTHDLAAMRRVSSMRVGRWRLGFLSGWRWKQVLTWEKGDEREGDEGTGDGGPRAVAWLQSRSYWSGLGATNALALTRAAIWTTLPAMIGSDDERFRNSK